MSSREGVLESERVIVSVKGPFAEHALDLAVPAGLAAAELIPLLAAALGGDADDSFELIAFPPGRALGPNETLAAAGTWTGAWLVLERRPA
ncbi:MAG TPA: EsaB/YukD family protein [Symbiobacteriaceae bacterium]|nr:EsaB/YukD family protein [Symbiobacteriaceae bacterium]